MNDKITVVSDLHINEVLQEKLDTISKLPRVAQLIALPDVHQKKKTEGPSSFATVVDNAIIPTLSSPSLNCGMAILATDLSIDELHEDNLRKTFAYFKSFMQPEFGYVGRLLVWLGLKKRTYNQYDISLPELEDIIINGSKTILNKYRLPATTCDYQEDGGVSAPEITITKKDLKKLLPRSSYKSTFHNLGTNFKGNHFLEFQTVEKIFNEHKAQELGLEPGQVMIMYHGGGGALAHQMGRYYANRKKNTGPERIQLFLGKLFLHIFSIDGLKHFATRWKYYFNPEYYQAMPADSFEGKRLQQSMKAAMNYGFAYRLATIPRLHDAFKHTLERDVSLRLIQNISHNNITTETIHNKQYFVHRHNVCQVRPDRVLLLPGDKYTNSYLLLGGSNGEQYGFSVDHGAGETAKLFKDNHTSTAIEAYTLKFDKRLETEKVQHYTSEGVIEVVEKLEQHSIAKRFVELKPFAVLKG